MSKYTEILSNLNNKRDDSGGLKNIKDKLKKEFNEIQIELNKRSYLTEEEAVKLKFFKTFRKIIIWYVVCSNLFLGLILVLYIVGFIYILRSNDVLNIKIASIILSKIDLNIIIPAYFINIVAQIFALSGKMIDYFDNKKIKNRP